MIQKKFCIRYMNQNGIDKQQLCYGLARSTKTSRVQIGSSGTDFNYIKRNGKLKVGIILFQYRLGCTARLGLYGTITRILFFERYFRD